MTLNELSQLYWLEKEIKMDEKRLADEGKTAEEIAVIIKEKEERCVAERIKLEKYIAGIKDSKTRLIFTLRFVKGYGYPKISVILDDGCTDISVRQRVYRYLKKHKKNNDCRTM